MPTSEELRGDSPSGLAANAPFCSALSLSFYPSLSELFGGCLTAPRSGALVYVKHPPKCHLKFTMAFYLNLTVKSCIIEKTNIAVIVRVFYEKKTYFDYMFISFILLDSFFGV